MYLSCYGDTGNGVIVKVGVFDAVGVLLGVNVAVDVKEGVNVAVFVDVFEAVGVLLAVNVTVGVEVKVGEGVIVGVFVGVPVFIKGVGLNVVVPDDSVAVKANVELGVAVGELSGASETAMTPTQ